MVQSLKEIEHIISSKRIGFITLHERLMQDYEGMLERYLVIFNLEKARIYLRHIFECRGIDFFADDFYEDHEYDFNNVKEIVNYVEKELNLKLAQMEELNEMGDIPTPMQATEEETKLYWENWERFERDFENGKFLDKKIKLRK